MWPRKRSVARRVPLDELPLAWRITVIPVGAERGQQARPPGHGLGRRWHRRRPGGRPPGSAPVRRSGADNQVDLQVTGCYVAVARVEQHGLAIVGEQDAIRGQAPVRDLAGVQPADRIPDLAPGRGKPAPDLPWRLAGRTASWGFNSVSWGFKSVARSSGPVCEAAAGVPELPGSSGRMSPCFPDDQAQGGGCRSPARACGSVPADRPRRFRRSHARAGRAGRRWRLMSPADRGPGPPFRVSVEW